jgi:hypothetical protein
MENSVEITQNLKTDLPLDRRNSTSEYIPKGMEIQTSKRFLHSCVHYSIVHNSQEVEI